jgi:hypothetical protein
VKVKTYIYIYIEREGGREGGREREGEGQGGSLVWSITTLQSLIFHSGLFDNKLNSNTTTLFVWK